MAYSSIDDSDVEVVIVRADGSVDALPYDEGWAAPDPITPPPPRATRVYVNSSPPPPKQAGYQPYTAPRVRVTERGIQPAADRHEFQSTAAAGGGVIASPPPIFPTRDGAYYSTGTHGPGMILSHATPEPVSSSPQAGVSSRTTVPNSPSPRSARLASSPRGWSPSRHPSITDLDRGVALRVVKCCLFSDHIPTPEFHMRIRMHRTDARRVYDSMTLSKAWCRGGAAGTSTAHVLLHNCFTEILRRGGVDWTRWFEGVSRRRVEETFKRITKHEEAIGLVLDRNSHGKLVCLRPAGS